LLQGVYASRSFILISNKFSNLLSLSLSLSLSLVSLLCLSFVSHLLSLCHGKCIIDLLLNPAVNPFTVPNGKKKLHRFFWKP
jgi:hypothetical protein